MRLLLFILTLAIVAQPLQAGFCAMEMGQGQSADTMQHGDMPESDGHDCCDTEEPGSDDGCKSGAHCGACVGGVSLLPQVLRIGSDWHYEYVLKLSDGDVLPSHASPPFRPPIS